MTRPIDRYLDELGRSLPHRGRLKRRVLAEAEDHLREAAREAGEEAAVARFGPSREVARGFAEGAAARSAHRAAQVLVLALGLAFLALYPIPENVLPPAPWPGDAPPQYLRWKQETALRLFVAAAITGAAAFVVARAYRPRTAAPSRLVPVALALTAVSLAALVGTFALGVVLALQWQAAVPGAPGVAWIGAYAALEAVVLGAAGALAVRSALLRLLA